MPLVDSFDLGRGAMRGFVGTGDATTLMPGICRTMPTGARPPVSFSVPSVALTPAALPAPVFVQPAPAAMPGAGGQSIAQQLATAQGQAKSNADRAGRLQQLLDAAYKTIAAQKAALEEMARRRATDVGNINRLNKLVQDQRVEMNRMYAIPGCRPR